MNGRFRRWRVAGAVALSAATLIGGGCDRAGGSPKAPAATAKVPLDLGDCAVIGASVSAGAEVSLPGMPVKLIATDANLADAFAAITRGPAPASFANMMFFSRPMEVAAEQFSEAAARKPRIVFALDYLFWHAYGGMGDARRRETLEKGLERLDSLDCPVVIADLPDMSHAIGTFLVKAQVPSREVLAGLNARIDEWAASRPRVVVVRLRGAVADAMAMGTVSLGGRTYEGEAARNLLVASGLHTSADGLIALALETLDRMSERGLIEPNRTWDRDADSVKLRLTETKVAAYQATRAPKPAATPAPAASGGD